MSTYKAKNPCRCGSFTRNTTTKRCVRCEKGRKDALFSKGEEFRTNKFDKPNEVSDKTYEGKACVKCTSTTRYLSNKHCVSCVAHYAADIHKRKRALAIGESKHKQERRIQTLHGCSS